MLVWTREFICHTGRSFKTYVQGKGDAPVQCTPIVFDDEAHCGVGIIVGNEILRWGLFAPRDYVASWRAGEILRHLGHIDTSSLRGAYYAASRRLNDTEEISCARPIVEKIGRPELTRIMSLSVPEEVVAIILKNRRRNLKPNLYPLTEEIEAGTLAWRNEFFEAGVLHPEQNRTRENSTRSCRPP